MEVGDVSLGEGVALVDGFVEESATFAAESNGREVIELGAGAAHV